MKATVNIHRLLAALVVAPKSDPRNALKHACIKRHGDDLWFMATCGHRAIILREDMKDECDLKNGADLLVPVTAIPTLRECVRMMNARPLTRAKNKRAFHDANMDRVTIEDTEDIIKIHFLSIKKHYRIADKLTCGVGSFPNVVSVVKDLKSWGDKKAYPGKAFPLDAKRTFSFDTAHLDFRECAKALMPLYGKGRIGQCPLLMIRGTHDSARIFTASSGPLSEDGAIMIAMPIRMSDEYETENPNLAKFIATARETAKEK